VDAPTTVFRFGPFDLDLRTGELRKTGQMVHLPPQPFKVLALLVRRRGDVVTRDEIHKEIWNEATFVDFDQGLNFCIRRIREALGDNADAPQYVETLPRRGYRFVMPVEQPEPPPAARVVTRMMVLPFRMLREDPETAFLAFSLSDAITNALSGLESLVMRSSLAASRFAGGQTDLKTIAMEANVDVVLAGSLVRSGEQLRVTTQLTEVPAGTLLWSRNWQVSLSNLFQLEDELSTRVVEALALPLTAREHAQLKRDIPRTAKAYECYLRANQLSMDSTRWAAARELYLLCVAEDPKYAPAWARLGRIHHVMGKYSGAGEADSLGRAEEAFKQALEINPELPLAHKHYAQLEADLGRALDAMVRLLGRARSADPEVFAGLVTVCRYCGLLDASVAADERARRLDPHVQTSVAHTLFVRGDFRLVLPTLAQNPYIGALSLGELGRQAEAVAALRALEAASHTLFRDFMIAARAFLEQQPEESLAAVNRIVTSTFGDPEGLFYLTRHLAQLNNPDAALRLFRRVVDGGYFCFPAMARDPWLDPIRKTSEFRKLLDRISARHDEAVGVFSRMQGDVLLGVAPRSGIEGRRRTDVQPSH